MSFVKLTLAQQGAPAHVYVNPECIVVMSVDGQITRVELNNVLDNGLPYVEVNETPDQVAELVATVHEAEYPLGWQELYELKELLRLCKAGAFVLKEEERL